jgi:endonuclease G, mitochondrial
MTNQHVFETADMVPESVVQFQYERNARGEELDPVEFGLRIDPPPLIDKALDFAIVAVEPASPARRSLQEFGWLRLNPAPGKAFVGEYLTIIQHPGGQRKQICVRENKLLKYVDDTPFIWYQTDTVGGSSGSPAFNTTWDVVALHHKSIPRVVRKDGRDVRMARNGQPWRESMGDDEVDWIANEGVRVSKIVEYLRQAAPDHPLTRAVTSAVDAPMPDESLAAADGSTDGVRVFRDRDGRIKVMVPVVVDLNMNVDLRAAAMAQIAPRVPPAPAPAPAANGRAHPAGPVIVDEAVKINTDNYDQRNGYQPDFLGGGLVVPLPKVSSAKFGSAVKVSGNKTELKYWNYSVVLNADRGLAFFSAGNILPAERRGQQDGNQFIRDKRIDADEQVGNEFYKNQSTFEADARATNPFDQGHLSRREDLQWGADARQAKRNGDDSFHYTNCAPQHFAFNQNRTVSGLWNRLEVSALEQLSSGDRVIIINGPVFNAPASKVWPDGKLRLQLTGARKKDPTFGGVAIPKLFFKLIVYRKDDGAASEVVRGQSGGHAGHRGPAARDRGEDPVGQGAEPLPGEDQGPGGSDRAQVRRPRRRGHPARGGTGASRRRPADLRRRGVVPVNASRVFQVQGGGSGQTAGGWSWRNANSSLRMRSVSRDSHTRIADPVISPPTPASPAASATAKLIARSSDCWVATATAPSSDTRLAAANDPTDR